MVDKRRVQSKCSESYFIVCCITFLALDKDKRCILGNLASYFSSLKTGGYEGTANVE